MVFGVLEHGSRNAGLLHVLTHTHTHTHARVGVLDLRSDLGDEVEYGSRDVGLSIARFRLFGLGSDLGNEIVFSIIVVDCPTEAAPQGATGTSSRIVRLLLLLRLE